MLDIMKFIFSSFWIWSGTVILIIVCGLAIFIITSNFKKSFQRKEIKGTKTKVGNASKKQISEIQEDPRLVNFVEKGLKIEKEKGN